jgi:hypothetical protein
MAQTNVWVGEEGLARDLGKRKEHEGEKWMTAATGTFSSHTGEKECGGGGVGWHVESHGGHRSLPDSGGHGRMLCGMEQGKPAIDRWAWLLV